SGPGAHSAAGVFANVTTDPLQVAWLAAAYAVADSNGTAGVVVLTDSTYQDRGAQGGGDAGIPRPVLGCAVLSAEAPRSGTPTSV
ncbi:hypothetical protein, partial [Kutzneria kofuensis]|uniref:hypothetical protein n=1 Tax=Kutzneria kofuensis TaxID=103725 RepID=UPI0031E68BC5